MSEAAPLLVHGFAHGEIVASLAGALGQRADKLVAVQARNGIVVLASPLDSDDVDQAFESSESITALALDHADVLAAIAALHDIVPLRLGTLVSGRQALADLCETQAVAMRRVLETIGGRVEFGVRVLQRPQADDAPSDRAKERPTDGRSYLRARALDRGTKLRTSESQAAYCASLTEHLQSIAAVTALGSLSARLAKGRLVDVACLVERHRANDFAAQLSARAAAAEPLSLELEITGPWPAYSFVVEPLTGTH